MHYCECSLLKLPVAMMSSVKSNGNSAEEKRKNITVIICKLSILKALPDTESAFCLSHVIIFSPFITLYLLVCFEDIFTLNS